MKFNKRLKLIMKLRGVSNYRLAQELHVSKSSVANWTEGRNLPELSKFIHLVKYLQVSSDYLLGLSDLMDIRSK